MAKKSISVVKRGDVWVAIKDGSTRASVVRNTQKEAYLAAKNIALNQDLTITVYPKGKKRVIHPKSTDDDDCFITTACIKYYGLNDECEELKTLRFFRDEYMNSTSDNIELVKIYYRIAPNLVKLLNKERNKEEIYKEIYSQIVLSCEAIKRNQFEKAKTIYVDVIKKLLHKYNFVYNGD